jgi:endo-1,4-beta-xylanase
MVIFFGLVLVALAIADSLASTTAHVKGEGLSPVNFILGHDNPLRSRQNYQQDYITGGDVVFTPDGNYYKVAWDTEDDFVVELDGRPNPRSKFNHIDSELF